MNSAITWDRSAQPRWLPAAGACAGAAFAFLLFWGVANVGRETPSTPKAEFEDLAEISLPMEAPPPPPKVQTPELPDIPIIPFEAEPAESPVRIAVVPPLPPALAAPVPVAPPAVIRAVRSVGEFKPRMDVNFETKHIFQQSELDQRVRVEHRANPSIPMYKLRERQTIRVIVTAVVEPTGRATQLKVLTSCGDGEIDSIVMDTIQNEWIFSPGMRRGKKVRTYVLQAVTISLGTNNSPFSL